MSIPAGTTLVLIDAVLYDGLETGRNPTKAVRLINLGDSSANLTNWQLSDGGTTAVFPSTILSPGQAIWITKEAGRICPSIRIFA